MPPLPISVKPISVIEDPCLVRLSAICLSLPEAVHNITGRHASFLVRKKIFAYYLNNHHGDGKVAFCCKVLPGDNAVLVRSDPARFFLPAYIGPRGWVALRLDLEEVDWEEVAELAAHSYLRTAPKGLCAMVSVSL